MCVYVATLIYVYVATAYFVEIIYSFLIDEFMLHYEEYASNEQLIHDVQHLLDLPPVQFPELIRTQEDLQYAQTLYGTYSEFLKFDAE